MPRPSAPPASAPRRSRARSWFIIFGLMIVVGVAGVGFALVAAIKGSGSGRAGHASAHLHESVVEDNDSHNKIALLSVEGVIEGGAMDSSGLTLPDLIHQQLERVALDSQVKAVVLKVDSPGGEVLASDEIYRHLWKFMEDHEEIPVVVSMGSLAASGGYYVSAPCQWIVANDLTMTGSIGVIFHSYNYRGLMDKVGVRPAITKSGKLKDMMSGEKAPEEELPEERQIMQSMIDESYTKFKEVIRNGRERSAKRNQGGGKSLAPDWETIADGRILSGRAALEKGLVDELGNLETALARARKLAGIEDADVVTFEPPPSLGHLFRMLGKAQSGRGTVRIDLGLGTGPSLPQGRMYFISPVHLR